MKTLTTILALGLALPAGAQTLESAAGNVKATLQGLRKDAARDKTDFKAAAVTNIEVEQDCQDITFEAAGPNVSQPLPLESRTYEDDCENVPLPYPPGGGMCIPQPRRLIFTDDATVTVELARRGTPAAKEVFTACLWGQSLSLRVKSSPFKYKWTEKDGRFTVTLK